MFTGIVRERGRLVGRNGGPDGVELVVEAPETAAATHTGDSVALDGVCLTATDVSDGRITFHAVPETMPELRAVTGGLDDVARGGVDGPGVGAGPDGVEGRELCLEYEVVRPPALPIDLSDGECARAV